MAFFVSNAFDYNDFVCQVRGWVQGHPIVWKPNDREDPTDGVVITGSGDGLLFVCTEPFTPAGSAASSPVGTGYTLVCTNAGGDGSPQAVFRVEQDGVSPAIGTLLAGERFIPDSDLSSPLGSPQNGLRLALTTTTPWQVGDTVQFRLVDNDDLGSQEWVEDRFLTDAPDGDGNFVTEWMTHAPRVGTPSPAQDVHFGMQTSFDQPNLRFNVAVTGADGFLGGSDFASQPNPSGLRYFYLSQNVMPFWVVADGDALAGVVNNGGVFEWFYLGLIDVFATGNQHPKPMFVGAMSEVNTNNQSTVDNDEHAAYWNPGDTSTSRFRWVDGSWLDIQHRANSYSILFNPTRFFWPVKSNTGAPLAVGTQVARTSQDLANKMIQRYDDSFEGLQLTLCLTDPQNAVVGDLKFIRYVTGAVVGPGDIGIDSTVSPARRFLIAKNAQLAGRSDFATLEFVP